MRTKAERLKEQIENTKVMLQVIDDMIADDIDDDRLDKWEIEKGDSMDRYDDSKSCGTFRCIGGETYYRLTGEKVYCDPDKPYDCGEFYAWLENGFDEIFGWGRDDDVRDSEGVFIGNIDVLGSSRGHSKREIHNRRIAVQYHLSQLESRLQNGK